MDHFGKKSTLGQNGLRKSAGWLQPDPGFKSKIVKKGQQNVFDVHHGNYLGLYINFGLGGKHLPDSSLVRQGNSPTYYIH